MLCFEDYFEILALYKMLIEAKFDSDPVNFDIAGSPFAAKVCEKTVKALIEMETSEEKKKCWEYWLRSDHKHTIFTDEFISNRRKELSEDGYSDEEIEQIISNEKNDKHNLTIWECALINASRDISWQKENHSQHIERAKNYLSPFIASDDEIGEFISLSLENSNFTVWEKALISASYDERWQKSDHSKQVEMAKTYLSPFIASDDEIEEFISLSLENSKNIRKKIPPENC